MTLRIKSALAPYGVDGALPRRLRTAPQCSSPFEKGGRTASLNFAHSPLGRRKGVAFPPLASVVRGAASRDTGCIAYGNLHPQVCPLDFAPAPRDGRVDGDDIFDTAAALSNTVTTVIIVTPLDFQV